VKKKAGGAYDPAVERAKGATLEAAAYDKTLKAAVIADKVTVGGKPGIVEISGVATGQLPGAGLEGTCDLWLSIFRFKRPDGTTNHVAGWNIPQALKPGQTPIEAAEVFAADINGAARPYKAVAAGDNDRATVTIIYTEKEAAR